MNVLFALRFCVLLCYVPLAFAQSALTQAQADRLGIRTQMLVADDVAVRHTFLGQVQIAPQAKHLVTRPFPLQAVAWQVSLGQVVVKDQPLLCVLVPALLELEHRYHNALSNARLTQQKLARESALIKEGVVSRKQFETTQSEHTQHQETVAGLSSQLIQMGLSAADLKHLNNMEHLEGILTIYAPVAGKIVQLDVSTGQSVAENASLLVIHTSDALTIEIPMPPAQAQQLSVGQTLRLADQTPLLIQTFRSQVSDAQKSMVVCQFQHPTLTAGQWVNVDIPSSSSVSTWRIPRNALTYLDDLPNVLVYDQEVLTAHPVTLLRATRDGWVVSAPDLTQARRIVVSGTASAKGVIKAQTP